MPQVDAQEGEAAPLCLSAIGITGRRRSSSARAEDDVGPLRRFAERGDLRAFDVLVDRHQGDCLSLAWALLGDAHMAQDVVQEVFITCCQQARSLLRHGLPHGLRPWLYRVTRNACLDRLRRRRPLALEQVREPSAPLAAQEHDGIWAAVDRLPPLHMAAVLLRYREQLSYQDIAARLDKSVSHIGVLLHEAVKALRADPHLRQEVLP